MKKIKSGVRPEIESLNQGLMRFELKVMDREELSRCLDLAAAIAAGDSLDTTTCSPNACLANTGGCSSNYCGSNIGSCTTNVCGVHHRQEQVRES